MDAQSVTDAAAHETSPAADETILRLQPLSAFPEAPGTASAATDRIIADWVRSYLMHPHPQLGRPGAVCPFTSAAARLDAIRVGSSPVHLEDEIHAVMRQALAAFEAIECAASQRHFRTVIVGFPNCVDGAARTLLRKAQNRMRPESVLRGKMIGLFEPDSRATGLLNPEFRPLRSPLPLLAIRMMVENDAPFVARNLVLVPTYLLKFPLTGPRKLWSALW